MAPVLGKHDPSLMCLVCGGKRYPKARYCKTCREDLAACKRDAEVQGKAGAWQEQCQTDAGLVAMVKQFQKTCQSRGRGLLPRVIGPARK